MATAAARPRRTIRTDDMFFSGMAVVSLIAVLAGFARTYFLAGVFRAFLPNLLISRPRAVFTLWIILFVLQIGLVTTRRLGLHRRFGLVGLSLAALMVVLGLLAARDRLTRHVGEPGKDKQRTCVLSMPSHWADLPMFATFIGLGYRHRSNPAGHKRLILATFVLLDAAFDRWSIFDPYPLPLVDLICFGLLVVTMAYDWWLSGRMQRVTMWSTAFLLAVQQSRYPIGYSAGWQHV